MTKLTAKRLREVLNYDPDTGIFRWRKFLNPRGMPGTIAGCVARYRFIGIDRKHYTAHRLAWLYYYGKWPTSHIDHKNLEKDDNRIENLREATRAQNRMNERLRKRNKIGLKGVGIKGSKYQARITIDGKMISLGLFSSPQKAHAAYCKQAHKHFGEFARTK